MRSVAFVSCLVVLSTVAVAQDFELRGKAPEVLQRQNFDLPARFHGNGVEFDEETEGNSKARRLDDSSSSKSTKVCC